mmetsp:Transcript_15352/g.32539  ORF Transcript_15352/g.32539 Transcript_15352/m.32539 type:complete len:217 (+) Transcript_15352:863-1513(+)
MKDARQNRNSQQHHIRLCNQTSQIIDIGLFEPHLRLRLQRSRQVIQQPKPRGRKTLLLLLLRRVLLPTGSCHHATTVKSDTERQCRHRPVQRNVLIARQSDFVHVHRRKVGVSARMSGRFRRPSPPAAVSSAHLYDFESDPVGVIQRVPHIVLDEVDANLRFPVGIRHPLRLVLSGEDVFVLFSGLVMRDVPRRYQRGATSIGIVDGAHEVLFEDE